MIQGDCQLACHSDTTSIETITNRDNGSMVPHLGQKPLPQSLLEHSYAPKAAKASRSDREISDVGQRISCRWQGCSHVLLSPEDQAAHESVHLDDQSSSDSALLASQKNERHRFKGGSEDTYRFGEKGRRVSSSKIYSTEGSSILKPGSSASSSTLRATPSTRSISPRHPNLKADKVDIDRVVQHKVEGAKVAHKIAEQKRRNEFSSLITEVEHCLPSEYLNGCQPRNQKPGYTKNGILKAMLLYHKHQATVTEEQEKIIEAQAAAIAALQETLATFMQQAQHCTTCNGPAK